MSGIMITLLGAFSNGGGANFIGTVNTGSATSVAVDTQSNSYFIGSASGGGLEIVKINAAGAIAWQYVFQGTGSGQSTIDSTGNLIVSFSLPSALDGGVVKITSAAAISWQKTLSSTESDYMYGVGTDTSDNVIVSGYTNGAFPYGNVAKYNSSGTLSWQRKIGGSGASAINTPLSVTSDSNGNIYVVGGNTGTGTGLLIVKYNTNGVVQWQKKISTVSASCEITVSGTSVYFSVGNTANIVALDTTTGNILWQKSLNASSSIYVNGICTDSSGNVYVTGAYNDGSNKLMIVKFNSSGTIQWQRYLSNGSVLNGSKISASSNNIYVSGDSNVSGTYRLIIISVPLNGSKTGVYTVGAYTYTYAAASLTVTSPSYTIATSTELETVNALTNATPTNTLTSTSLTSTITLL